MMKDEGGVMWLGVEDEGTDAAGLSLAKTAKRKQTGGWAAMSEAEVDAQMAKAPRLPGLIVSLDNFRLVYRKGGDCDCKPCIVTANLRKFLIDIQRWHSVPDHGCMPEFVDSS